MRSYKRKTRNLDPPAFGGLPGPVANLARRLLARREGVTGRGPLFRSRRAPQVATQRE